MLLEVGNTSRDRNIRAELLDKPRLKVGRSGKVKPALRGLAEHRRAEDSMDYRASNLDTVKDRPRCQPRGACVHYSRTKACADVVAVESDPAVAVDDDSYSVASSSSSRWRHRWQIR